MSAIDDLAVLAARLAVGLGYASHGTQKAYGWFEGHGPQGTAQFMESLGYKPGATYAALSSYVEIGAGTLIAAGLGGPIGPAALIANMIVAQTTVHAKNGFFASKGGVEVGVLYGAAALALASRDYGALSLDAALGLQRKLEHPALKTLALAAGMAAGWAMLGRRDVSPPEGTLATPTIRGGERNGSTAAAGATG